MTDAPHGTVHGALAGTIPMPTASLAGTVRAMVQATAEVVRAPQTTTADLQALAAVFQDAVRAAERLRTTSAGNHLDVAVKIATIVATVLALLTFVQGMIKDARPDPPPSVTVVVERPGADEIGRIVDERCQRPVQTPRRRPFTAPVMASDLPAGGQISPR